MRYQTDTEGGNSGSPVIDDATGFAVGVHTHGGCSVGGGGNNHGTSTFNAAFWDALDTTPPPPADLQVTLTPIGSTTIPPGGGSFTYELTLENAGGSSIAFQTWNLITNPGGGSVTLLGPFSTNFPPGRVFTRQFTQNIPGGAPAGTWTYSWLAGNSFPVGDLDSDSFPFTKTASPTASKASAAPVDMVYEIIDVKTGLALTPENFAAILADEFAGEVAAAPEAFVLEQNYPNPFNPSTVIRYGLSEASHVKVAIFDVLGKEITTLVDETQNAGYKSVTWNGRNAFGQIVPAGIYLYRVEAAGQVQIKKMILAK